MTRDTPGEQDNVKLIHAKFKDAFSNGADILPTRVARPFRPRISSEARSLNDLRADVRRQENRLHEVTLNKQVKLCVKLDSAD